MVPLIPDCHSDSQRRSMPLSQYGCAERNELAPQAFANRPLSEYNDRRYATLAQSAEQPLRKRQVLGSIPKGGSATQPPSEGASF